MGTVGVSDIVGFTQSGGRIVCVECKRPGQHPTAAQAAFLDRVQRSGGLAFVATCVEDVAKALQR